VSVSFTNPNPITLEWGMQTGRYIVCRDHNVMHNKDTMCHKCKWELQQLVPSVKEAISNEETNSSH